MPEPSYTDIERAVRTEKRQLWTAWFCGGVIWLIIAYATKDVPVLSVITQVLFFALGIAFTVIAIKMSRALNRKASTARRRVLGDD
ncbi:hypothetical protein ACIP9H_40430 [Streptomyces sp. NPDC088732]|uniref:hypothetical protein n=1 Tax=Streptomyces sp. NPDC088732 TaxID=3365879 RepID=UPI00380292B9